mmetsp:Transcript_2113/g.3018  ORF Transcript_2113/g.3018 Transcript_2113/m.3018 type:complete len:137 (+) Transcript_2113:38-448(+)
MSSGIAVSDEVVEAFNQVKLGRKHRYAVLRINDDNTQVVVEKIEDASKTYEDFTGELPSDECRYGVVDYEYKTKDGRATSKMLFVVWAPDSARIKSKMLITSTKDAVKKKLVGIGVEVQATDFSELQPSEFADRLN